MLPAGIRDVEEDKVPNMHGTWMDGQAKSRYFVENSEDYPVTNGNIQIAGWSDKIDHAPNQFYHLDNANNGSATIVEGLRCSGAGDMSNAALFVGDRDDDSHFEWGTVVECEKGPSLASPLQELHPLKTTAPPTIILNSTDGDVHLIVEESSSYPSFLYSVWAPSDAAADGGDGASSGSDGTDVEAVELRHVFHIASTVRLAEAVVTGIVHSSDISIGADSGDGEPMPPAMSGGRCFALLRQFSEYNPTYTSNLERASPFGEHPAGGTSSVAKLSQVENIEAGVELSVTALLCGVWLLVVVAIGFAWSLCLRSSIDMDIYDRDELIRAVSQKGARPSDAVSAIRMFVREEDDGSMSVAISDTGDKQTGCAQFFWRKPAVVEIHEPAPTAAAAAAVVEEYNNGYGGARVPVERRTIWLQTAMRTGRERALPGRAGNFTHPQVDLVASPVPSNAPSLAGTPTRCPSSPAYAGTVPPVMHVSGQKRCVADLFDSNMDSPDSSVKSRHDRDDRGNSGSNSHWEGVTGQRLGLIVPTLFRNDSAKRKDAVAPSGGTSVRDALDKEESGYRDDKETTSPLRSGHTTPQVSEGASPVPTQGLSPRCGLHRLQAVGLLEQESDEESGQPTPPVPWGASPVPVRGISIGRGQHALRAVDQLERPDEEEGARDNVIGQDGDRPADAAAGGQRGQGEREGGDGEEGRGDDLV